MPLEIENNTITKCLENDQEITVPEGITSIGIKAFAHNNQLMQVNLPNSLHDINDVAFYSCHMLQRINIPKGVTSIGALAFEMCCSLTKINIPEGVKTIKARAFSSCTNLTQINIPQSVTFLDKSAFKNCHKLQRILVNNNREVERIKSLLPRQHQDKVTCYFLKHQQNLKIIRKSQLLFFLNRYNLFEHSNCAFKPAGNAIISNIYQFLSFNDILNQSPVCSQLKLTKAVVTGIMAIPYCGKVPFISPEAPFTTYHILNYPHFLNDSNFKIYANDLNIFKKRIQSKTNSTIAQYGQNPLFKIKNKTELKTNSKTTQNYAKQCVIS